MRHYTCIYGYTVLQSDWNLLWKSSWERLLAALESWDLTVCNVSYAGKTKYMVMSRDLNAGWSHVIKTHDIAYERLGEFKYLGTTLMNQNSIREEIKSRFKSGNACIHLVQNLLSSSLLSKNSKIKMYRTIILPVVLYGCETWSLTLREEHRLTVFKSTVLRRIFFGPKRDDVMGEWRKLCNEELNNLYFSPNIVRVIKSRRRD